jgi:hypothetical protein
MLGNASFLNRRFLQPQSKTSKTWKQVRERQKKRNKTLIERAHKSRGVVLAQLRRDAKALTVYDGVLKRWPVEQGQEQLLVGRALVNKGITLSQLTLLG